MNKNQQQLWKEKQEEKEISVKFSGEFHEHFNCVDARGCWWMYIMFLIPFFHLKLYTTHF